MPNNEYDILRLDEGEDVQGKFYLVAQNDDSICAFEGGGLKKGDITVVSLTNKEAILQINTDCSYELYWVGERGKLSHGDKIKIIHIDDRHGYKLTKL